MAKSSTTFSKGKSANPAGRPPGKTSRSQFRELVKPALPSIVKSLIRLAKTGDTQSAKIIIERLIPALRPTSDALVIKATGTLAERGEAVITAMVSGLVSPDQAVLALNALTAQSNLTDVKTNNALLLEFQSWVKTFKEQRI
jgi:hypothetical protein